MEHEDISREGFTREKLLQFLRLVNAETTHAIAKISEFRLLNVAKINELLGTDFQGVILDVDECVAPHHGEITAENIRKIQEICANGMGIVIHSNMQASARYDEVIESEGGKIHLHKSRFAKPDPRGFLECAEVLSLEPSQIIMVGDNFLTDGGSISAGIPFVKVRPLSRPVIQNLTRAHQVVPRMVADRISDYYDWITARRVLRDDDLIEDV